MPTLIVLIGPTGVGKTELSLRLAETFQTSIVSADSRQLYAELKIAQQLLLPINLNVSPINWSARSTSQTITALLNTKQKHWIFWRNYSRNTK